MSASLVAVDLFADAWHARFGADASVPAARGSTLDVLLAHRSVRAFTPDPLSDDTLAALIGAAQSAATSSNMQAWSVVAIRDASRKARLADLCGRQAFITQAPVFLAFVADLSRTERVAARVGAAVAGLPYLEAFLVAAIDAALAAQNCVVAAESLGLGAAYVGSLRNAPEAVAAELCLPPATFGVFGLAIGVPDPAVATAIKPRLPNAAVLHRETYATDGETDAVVDHDARHLAFREREGLSRLTWSERASQRWATVAALVGRDRLRAALKTLGIEAR